MKILSGHISADTAYIVDDYPYGFRLRCKIRYWLEYKAGKGFRFWSQTTNPKRDGEVWNKPKASTFCMFGGAMYINGDGHVSWTGCHEYMNCAELVAWRDQFGLAMPADGQRLLAAWIARKLAFEQAKTEGAVSCTITTTQYGCVTDPNFGKNPIVTEQKTEVLNSEYTAEQLIAMGRSLRAPISTQLATL
jgi:hypothetical protein